MDSTSGSLSEQPTPCADPSGWRVGVPREMNVSELSGAARASWSGALESLKRMGCSLEAVSLPTLPAALTSYYVIATAEAASNLARYDGIKYGHRPTVDVDSREQLYRRTRGEGFGQEVRKRVLVGNYVLSTE